MQAACGSEETSRQGETRSGRTTALFLRRKDLLVIDRDSAGAPEFLADRPISSSTVFGFLETFLSPDLTSFLSFKITKVIEFALEFCSHALLSSVSGT